MKLRPPSPQSQVRFLQQLQRVLDEGSFVATYKYALLHAIADLCVAVGDDSGAPLTLSTRVLADRFVELYWRQSIPFPVGLEPGLLRQNTGRPAAIVRRVAEARSEYGGSLPRIQRESKAWGELIRDVERTVRVMPLWKLQTVGPETVDFLYENAGKGREITLKPGVAYCFRAFYPLITDMVEGAWSHYIRRHNRDRLGTTVDLRTFLFGSQRSSLVQVRGILEDLQDGSCFYCERKLPRECHVDHFIPWRRYPVDLGHNFVLAHPRCNSQKGDRLAAPVHLGRWHERNEAHGPELQERFGGSDIRCDLPMSYQVAVWAYEQVQRVGGSVWVEGTVLEPLGGSWRRVLGEDTDSRWPGRDR